MGFAAAPKIDLLSDGSPIRFSCVFGDANDDVVALGHRLL